MSKKCNLISGAILTMTLALASFQTMAAPIEGWVDNTADFDIAKTNRWDINNNQDSRYRLDITNNSNKRIERPYRLAFENLTPGVQVQGAK